MNAGSHQGLLLTKRIVCIVLCALLYLLNLPAEAQQLGKVYRIGYLNAASLSATSTRIAVFREALRELGYIEGKNIVIEWRSADGKPDRLPALAAELGHAQRSAELTEQAESLRVKLVFHCSPGNALCSPLD